jgi:hypothetical protein
MSDPYNEGPDAKKARGRRNLMLAAALVAFVIIVFVVTIVRLGGNVGHP